MKSESLNPEKPKKSKTDHIIHILISLFIFLSIAIYQVYLLLSSWIQCFYILLVHSKWHFELTVPTEKAYDNDSEKEKVLMQSMLSLKTNKETKKTYKYPSPTYFDIINFIKMQKIQDNLFNIPIIKNFYLRYNQ